MKFGCKYLILYSIALHFLVVFTHQVNISNYLGPHSFQKGKSTDTNDEKILV